MTAFKKIAALVMAMVMISTCGIATAFAAAEDVEDTTKTKYTITVTPTTNGTVGVLLFGGPPINLTSAEEGTELNISINPSKGYLVDTISCKTEDGKEIPGRIFVMPASNIVVTVTFKEDPNPPRGDNFFLQMAEDGNYHGGYGTELFLMVDGHETNVTPFPWGFGPMWINEGREATLRIVPGESITDDATYRITIVGVTCTGAELTKTEENVYKFIMPNNQVNIAVEVKTVTEPVPIDPGDVEGDTEGAETVDGTPIVGISVSSKPEKGDVDAIQNALEEKLKELGLKQDKTVASFDPIDIKLQATAGEILNGILKKPIDITIKITTPGFKPTPDTLRIFHNHKGEIEVIKPKRVTAVPLKKDTYWVTFPMSKFSTIMLVAVAEDKPDDKPNKPGSNSNSYFHDDSSSRPSYGGLYAREFDGLKISLSGGEIVPAKAVEEIAGKDKEYTVTYMGKTYTFHGKKIPKPASNIIYYTAEEFMKLVTSK